MPQATCVVDGCNRKREQNQLCRGHLRRWRLHGDPLAGGPVRIGGVCTWDNSYRDVGDGLTLLIISREERSDCTVSIDTLDRSFVERYWWHIGKRGYIMTTTHANERVNRNASLHRLLLGLTPDDELVIDHADGDVTNNRRTNLRITSQHRNTLNQAAVNRRASSRFRGVSWDRRRQKWRATVSILGTHHALGRFPTEEAAAEAVARFRRENGLPPGY